MNPSTRKGIVISLAVLVAAAILYSTNSKGSRGATIIVGQEPLAELPAAEISAIVITDESGTLTLVQKEEQWVVDNRNGYPANVERIENFQNSFIEMKALRELSAGKGQLDQIGLKEEGGTHVTLQNDKRKAIHRLTLGKELTAPGSENQQSPMGRGGFPDRRFVMIDGDRTAIIVVDQTFSNATSGPADWLDKSFFKIENPTSIEVNFNGTDSTNSWKISKPTELGDWKLAGELPEGKELTPNPSAVSALSSPSFNDLASETDQLALDKNATQIKVQTAEGFQYALKVADGSEGTDKVISVQISASFPDKRTPGENESDEDKQRLDEEWAAKQQELKDKLAREQKFSQHTYRISNGTVSAYLEKRTDLLRDIEKGAIAPPLGGGTTPFPFQIPPPQE